MTSADVHRSSSSVGWLASLSIHAVLALGAVVLGQRVTFSPHIPFTWQVAMVASSSNGEGPSAALSGNPETLAQPLHSPVPLRSGASGTRQMPRAVQPSTPSASESPILPTPVLVEPAEERIEQTASNVQTGDASRLYDQQAERPSESDSVPLPPPAQAFPTQPEGLSPASPTSITDKVSTAARPDYTWLSETILRRMEELKKYPAEARLNQAQGKVVLKAIIRSDGSVEGVEVAQTSGHHSLDQAAVELLRAASPFQLSRALDKPRLTVKIPMSYRLQ